MFFADFPFEWVQQVTESLAFFWLALRTLTFWVVEETTRRSLQVKLLGGVQKSAKKMSGVSW